MGKGTCSSNNLWKELGVQSLQELVCDHLESWGGRSTVKNFPGGSNPCELDRKTTQSAIRF